MIVAITGGIGSGKSVVSQVLRLLGGSGPTCIAKAHLMLNIYPQSCLLTNRRWQISMLLFTLP